MGLDKFLEKISDDQKEIVQYLDKTLMDIQPEYESKLAWGGWAYKVGNNYSCMIVSYKDHVKLMIWRGVDLKDPNGVLEGKGVNTRHIKFFVENDVDKTMLNKLLLQQFKMFEDGIRYE